jgi:IS30 family transposase
MDHSYSNTKPHQTGKHLSKDDRITIQVIHSIGCSNRAIARELNCLPSTIGYDQKRHRIPLYWQCETIQSCQGTKTYERHRRECGRKSLFLHRSKFINYVSHCFHKRGWSLDACVSYALVLISQDFTTQCLRSLLLRPFSKFKIIFLSCNLSSTKFSKRLIYQVIEHFE